MDIYEQLKTVIPEDRILRDEPMSRHTSFRTGGNADLFCIPSDREELCALIAFLKDTDTDYTVIGNGSNLLVSDRGYPGVIIQMMSGFSGISREGEKLSAGAGELLSRIAEYAREEGLKGLEFASGIPGTLGGAVVMNAGAYGGEMKDIVTEVEAADSNGNLVVLNRDSLGFGYRRSSIRPGGYTVLGAVLRLSSGNREEIGEKMEELKRQRNEKQPLNLPSAGSTFKRPEGHFAGKLIMEAGLRGFSEGGAQVSEKHCGFIVNKGNATSDDIYRLICLVKKRVFENSGVELEPEVCLLGEFTE